MLQPAHVFELSADNAPSYLIAQKQVPAVTPVTIEELGWGISNTVLKVRLPDDCFVMKQSLPKLRVQDDWPFDRSRIVVERDCMACLAELLPAGSVPTVRFSDDANYVFAMSCAPDHGMLWEQQLIEGTIEPSTAVRAGLLLAELHTRTSTDSYIRARFADQSVFLQGRIDPYHRTAARAHPDLAPLIEAEVQRMLATRRVLVHGDYSPKNMFVYPDRILILDFEVAHVGDPAFDAAFCLNHLVLPAIQFPDHCAQYLAAALDFWHAYINALQPQLRLQLEATTIRELGCLLLARIDGKSKIPYITLEATKDRARSIARAILTAGERSLDRLLAMIDRQIRAAELP